MRAAVRPSTVLTLLVMALLGSGCGGESASPAASTVAAPKVAPVDGWTEPDCAGDCVAAEGLLTAAYDRCRQASGGVTQSLLACDEAERGRQEAALDATYQRVLRKASGSRRADLTASQAAWRAAATSRADDLGNQYGTGSLGLAMRSRALMMTRAQRRLDLQRFEAEGLVGPARP